MTKIKNGRLIISLKLQKPTHSKSGKTLVVASTHGVKRSSVLVDGKPVLYNANAYVSLDRTKRRK